MTLPLLYTIVQPHTVFPRYAKCEGSTWGFTTLYTQAERFATEGEARVAIRKFYPHLWRDLVVRLLVSSERAI